MGLWKRVQRIGKKASKFEFVISYTDLVIEYSKDKWLPNNVAINWTRKNRNKRTLTHDTTVIPGATKSCHIDFRVPETVTSTVTLYHNDRPDRGEEFEDKPWTIIVETTDKSHKPKPIANIKLNMNEHATAVPSGKTLELKLKPLSDKYTSVVCHLMISCTLLKQGMATDDDMISLASLMSYGQDDNASASNADVGNLDDFDDSMETPVASFASFTAQMGQFLEMVESDPWQPQAGCEGINNQEADNQSGSQAAKLYIGTPPPSPKTLRENEPPPKPPRTSVGENISTSQPAVEPPLDAEVHKSGNEGEEETRLAPKGSLDLLSWCKAIVTGYDRVKITNFTTSWRNGMAFAAVIHHFKPALIDYDNLNPRQTKENNEMVFAVVARLGIPCIIRPEDMTHMKVPDKLTVMTFLHSLRSHFEGVSEDHSLTLDTNKPKHALSSVIFGETPYQPSKEAMKEIRGEILGEIKPSRQRIHDLLVSEEPIVAEDPFTSYSQKFRTENTRRLTQKYNTALEDSFENALETEEKIESGNPQPLKPAQIVTTPPTPVRPPVQPKESLNPFESEETHPAPAVPVKPPSVKESLNPFESETHPTPAVPVKPPSVKESLNPFESETHPTPAVPVKPPSVKESLNPFESETHHTPAVPVKPPSVKESLNPFESETHPTPAAPVKPLIKVKELRNPFDSDSDSDDPYAVIPKPSRSSIPKASQPAKSMADGADPVLQFSDNAGKNFDTRSVEVDGGSTISNEDHDDYQSDQLGAPSSIQFKPQPTEEHLHIEGKLVADQRHCVMEENPKSRDEELLARARELIAQARGQGSNLVNKEAPNKTEDSVTVDHQPIGGQGFIKVYDTREFVFMEMANLEHQQKLLDDEARRVEKLLRRAIKEGNALTEEVLSRRWFALLNEKNSLIRRQEELNILEKEENLMNRHQLLTRELRKIISLQEWEKSHFIKEKESALMEELVVIVDKRNALVTAQELQNASLDEDHATMKEVEGQLGEQPNAKQCSIQ